MNPPPEDRYADEFLRAYRETVRPLYRYVSRRCGGDRGLAEDVTQETFLRAVNQWRDNRIPESPIAWLQYVARNLIINHFERHRPRMIDPATLDQMLDPATNVNGEAAALVQHGFARLGSGQSKILEAFYLEGKAVRTIAEEMNLTERAVEGRLRRSRKALRKQLDGHADFSGGLA